MPASAFFTRNAIVVYVLYGQVFILMGFSITVYGFLYGRDSSALRLARRLWLLAVFGLTHGLGEWGVVFIPIQAGYLDAATITWLRSLNLSLFALSYTALSLFAATLIGDTAPRWRWLPALPVVLLALWFTNFLVFGSVLALNDPETWFDLSDAWSRYLMALPGSLGTALALLWQVPDFVARDFPVASRQVRRAAYAFVAYALFAGLIVPRAAFFPASLLNAQAFLEWVGVPVQLFRAAAGAAMAFYIIRTLTVFGEEHRRRLEESERTEAVLRERERFGRDLHDGIIQSLYAAGLLLQRARALIAEEPAEATRRIDLTIERLDGAIGAIRSYIKGLDPGESRAMELRQRVAALVEEYRATAEVPVELRFEGVPSGLLPAEATRQLEAIVREALANVVKHARARRAEVRVEFQPGVLACSVLDDGAGFDPAAVGGSTQQGERRGLKNLAARVELLGGSLELNSRPGAGTAVVVRVPLKEVPRERQGVDRR